MRNASELHFPPVTDPFGNSTLKGKETQARFKPPYVTSTKTYKSPVHDTVNDIFLLLQIRLYDSRLAQEAEAAKQSRSEARTCL